MKEFPLVGDWSLALDVRDNGERVGAILRARVLQADLLGFIAKGRGFVMVRPARAASRATEVRRLRREWERDPSPFDPAVKQAIEETLSRELGVPTELVLLPLAGETPMRIIFVPPGSGGP